jgi:hypothetical protein
VLGGEATEPLADHHPGQGGTQQPRKGLLPLRIGHLVADPGNRQGHDAGRSGAHGNPRQHQQIETRCQRGGGAE